MTALVQPIRYDRMQAAIVSVLEEAAGVDVGFAYGPAVFDGAFDADFINVTPTLGPVGTDRGGRGFYLLAPSQIDLEIPDAIVVGRRYLLDINRHGFYHDAVTGNTATAVIDGLVAAVGTDPHFIAARVAGPLLRLTPRITGGLWHVQMHAGWDLADLDLSDQAIKVVDDVADLTLSIGCFSKGSTPMDGAWSVAAAAAGAFESGDLLERLSAADVSIKAVGGGVDLSDVAGAAWQTRVSFDVRLSIPAFIVRPVERVERIVLDMGPFSLAVDRP